MKAEVTSTCQTCGARVPAGLDFCPVCALVGAGDHNSSRADALNPTSELGRSSAESEVSLASDARSTTQHEPASRTDPLPHAPQTVRRFENYEVMLDQDGKPIELGRGAMGITYKGFDSDLHFPVTLKVISEKYVGDESARLRFLREARAAAKVRHPNVASVFHLGRNGGEYFYAMEFVEGETLERLIKRSGQLEVKLALEITSQVAAGLDAVQEQKLVHRDIKPSNIMVRLKDEGRVTAKIIDLGLAKGVSESGSQSGISAPGAFAGTPEFASPEQFAGVGVDIRSDLYSLGVTLWEMLVGQAPFRGPPSEVMYQHQHGSLPIDQLKRVPGPVVALLEVLLQKDPAERIQSPADICNAIQLVTTAVEAGRSVSLQELKATARVQLAGFQKTGKFAKRLKALFTTPRVRYPAWLLLALLIAGVVILAVNAFFGVRHPATESSVTPPASLTVPEKSIAVLPFESLSDNKGDTYFADGVQDEILSRLAKLSQLKVISRTSVMAYRPPNNQNVRSIGTSLGVAHLVEGTVQRDGNRVRITTELIDARTDATIWSESYQRDLTDIFAIQSEIAEAVALKLSTRLSPEEQKNIGQRPTTNLEAYDLYLQAKELVANWGVPYKPDDLPKAIKLLDEATKKDPKFTLAYCVLARAHDDLYHYRIDKTPERRALADAAVNEALRLEPDSPEAHLAMAYHLYECYRNYERASVQVELAQKVLSSSPEALKLTGRIDRRLGRWDDSTKALEKAYNLDPRNPDIMFHLAINYGVQHRYREADQINYRLDEIVPDPVNSKTRKASAEFLRTGDPTTLRAVLDQLPPSTKARTSETRFWLALYARDWTAAKHGILTCPSR